MAQESWKQRLIGFAHATYGQSAMPRPWRESYRTVLGKKIYLKKIMTQPIDWLKKIRGEVSFNEPLAKHTSIKIGGPADIFIRPCDLEDLRTLFKNKGTTPVFVIGEGSNLLVLDGGIQGIVVSLQDCSKSIKRVAFERNDAGEEIGVMQVEAGVKMSYLAKYAARYGLTGIEGLVGIPGSLGGALVMNAGAEGMEIGQVVRSITRVTPESIIQKMDKSEMNFEYRKTVFPPGGGIIVEAEIELRTGDRIAIQETIDRHLAKRSATQPLNLPNSGSVFKNPPGDKAGRLIESLDLKGFQIGDAAISLKHANFIVNKGDASADDVLELIKHVQKTVKEKTGIDLEREILVVGK